MYLSPVEYEFVSYPLLSAGSDLLRLTLQDLCLRQVITVETRWIYINDRELRKRERFFFGRGPQFLNYQTEKRAEKFVLELLKEREEFRFYMLRHHVINNLGRGEIERFKSQYVQKDIYHAGLSFLFYFPTPAAWKAARKISQLIDKVDRSVDRLLANNKTELKELLAALGTNVLFLKSKTIAKLEDIEDSVIRIKDLRFMVIMENPFSDDGGAFSGGFGGGSFGGGGFGGFGGGSFGGGGAGGSW